MVSNVIGPTVAPLEANFPRLESAMASLGQSYNFDHVQKRIRGDIMVFNELVQSYGKHFRPSVAVRPWAESIRLNLIEVTAL